MTEIETESLQMDDSPLAKYLEIEQDVDSGGGHCHVTIDSRHLNPNGSFHGGAMFTMLDLVMGIATNAHRAPDRTVATSDIHIRFIRPVFEGVVRASATVVSAGRRIIQVEAKATNDAGKLVASATGSFVVLERRDT